MILTSVWGYEFFPNTRTVHAHVVKLRQKMEPDVNTPKHFLTVHGVGYQSVPSAVASGSAAGSYRLSWESRPRMSGSRKTAFAQGFRAVEGNAVFRAQLPVCRK